MKSSFKIIVIIAIVAIAVIPAQGQVRFGVKGGITINELKWDKNILSVQDYVIIKNVLELMI